MLKSLNKHCLSLLSATLLSSAGAYGVVEKDKAQIITANKTVPGSIVSISKVLRGPNAMPGMRMVLATKERKKILVHLSAEWILLNQRLGLTPGDRVIVSGPVIKSGNQAALVAKSIKKGGKKIVLTRRSE